MKKRPMHPESMMMSYGYRPEWSEGAIKCPIFQTSTFVFRNAQEGKAFFELAYGLREADEGEQPGMIYSRLNNPDLEVLEDRLTLWDKAEDCAVFESGMSAISSALFEFLEPGDLLLHSNPLYGGTDHFIRHVLHKFGIETVDFYPGQTEEEIEEIVRATGKADRLAMIFIETPANPTNNLIDISACNSIAEKFSSPKKKVLLAVDNTYLGPLWQHPLSLGADLVIYSATKYIGGHSDVIAGACLGSSELIKRMKNLRTFLGNMAGPWTGWLLLRSLETLKVRMEKQASNAQKVANFLREHPKVQEIHYLGHLTEADGEQYKIYQKQCLSPGAMIAFRIKGNEEEAFEFLNGLKLFKLAVSLGSTESLAQHPASMTHAGVDPELREQFGVFEDLIRLSIGVEHPDDLIWDLEQALEQTPATSQDLQSLKQLEKQL